LLLRKKTTLLQHKDIPLIFSFHIALLINYYLTTNSSFWICNPTIRLHSTVVMCRKWTIIQWHQVQAISTFLYFFTSWYFQIIYYSGQKANILMHLVAKIDEESHLKGIIIKLCFLRYKRSILSPTLVKG